MSPDSQPNRSTRRSKQYYSAARKVIPGGVNSPVRAYESVGGTPLFIEEAQGAYVTDVDGNKYVDYVGSWGPMLFGHADPETVQAIQQAATRSPSFGAPTEIETEVAELICDLVPSVDQVRMVNSGTEATMTAVRLARGYTGRDKVIKFAGNYHGHGDFFLIAAGSGATTLGRPDSPGVTQGNARDTLVAQFNNLATVEQLVDEFAGEIAAIIIEPVAGNMGCIPPEEGFLEGLREIADQEDIVLIFDEVMTGFRVAPGGAQERFGVTPDLTTLGKIVGGGMPVGAVGGRLEVMEALAPTGPVYQAGTLSGNPLAMAAGRAVLNQIAQFPGLYEQLESYGRELEDAMRENLDAVGLDYYLTRVGSMGSLFFTEGPVSNYKEAQSIDEDLFGRYFHEMLKQGVYLAPSPFEAYFFSTQHGEEELEKTQKAQRRALEAVVDG